ncbi:MAG TPA: menaquinone biosynthesis decarboxylase [Bacteroidia bacterium]|nr:menaquinone biosynthesis decarboxylase [Bacteroidia bacterium]
MAYRNLRHFIKVLEEAGELVRIKEFVDPNLEITEVTDRISKQYGPALLFENTGTNFPVLINAMGTEKRMAMALGVKQLDEVAREIESLFKTFTSPKNSFLDKLKLLPQLGEVASWMPKTVSGRGECQQVILQQPDITKFPVLTCWPEDGGPFITLPVIQTKDPNTGIRNVGLYRMQVFGPTLTGMHWHRHKVSARHFNEYKKLGQKMPVVISIGGDPVYTYSGTAPLPDGVDEFMLAGFLRKKRVELVQCITQDMQVPADADIIIEGYVDPNEEFILEGPFGDHTGYYSLADYYPKFHITCITHRNDPVYLATIVGIPPQEDAWIGKATERIFLAPIKMTMVPEIVDMVLPIEGVFHNLCIVKIKKDYPGQALKVMNSLWGAGQMMFTKMMIVVDGEVDIHNNLEVAKYISENTDPATDFVFSQGPTDVLDHSCSTMAFGGKMGIDATKKLPEELAGKSMVQFTGTLPDAAQLKKVFPEITDINSSLLALGVSVVMIAVEKNRKGHVKELAGKLFAQPSMRDIKVVLFLEHNFPVTDTADAVWRFSNNLDPRRDHIQIYPSGDAATTHMAFDGTRKTKEYDGFTRDWPNILASTDETIAHIDAIWDKLGLGPFIQSPSKKYRKQLYKGGAVVEE